MLRTDRRMAVAILGGIIAVGIGFLLWVLFKITLDRYGKNRPKLQALDTQLPSVTGESTGRNELETTPPQRV